RTIDVFLETPILQSPTLFYCFIFRFQLKEGFSTKQEKKSTQKIFVGSILWNSYRKWVSLMKPLQSCLEITQSNLR
ncbi:MAG: hypothetical protein C4517_06570, partial [Stygiobacter sp.]